MRIFLLLLLLVGLHAAETLSIDVTATTIPTGRPKNGNDNAVALWVVGSGGTLTKTMSRWVGTSTNPGARNGYTGLTWWRSFTEGGPEIDATLVDSTQPLSDYDEETQTAIRKLVAEQSLKQQVQP